MSLELRIVKAKAKWFQLGEIIRILMQKGGKIDKNLASKEHCKAEMMCVNMAFNCRKVLRGSHWILQRARKKGKHKEFLKSGHTGAVL